MSARGAGDFQKILHTEGAGPLGGLQNLGGAKDFDEFCKNVKRNFLRFYPIFRFYVSQWLSWQHWF